MVSSIRYVALLIVSAVSVFGGIDLMPTPSTYKLEGIKFPEILFHDGKKTISYDPPFGWTYNGTSTKCTLQPPGKAQAQASIELASSPKTRGFDEERIKQLKATAATLLPAGSENVEIASAELDPLQINGNSTFELTISYMFYGQPFKMSVLFLDVENSELRFRLQSQSSDFQELQKAFRRSLFSWQWLPVGS
jgi:hypothetical protein